jgi:uncharacterized protein (TIGR02444 family)
MAGDGSPFWRFSLDVYRRPGVADACLVLQDQCRVDVNLLMFLLWQASTTRALGLEDVRALDEHVRGWREGAIAPLRAQRRSLKERPPSLLTPEAAEAFRTRVKTLELEAERLQQEAMFRLAEQQAWGQVASSPAEAARRSIAAYQQHVVCEFPVETVKALLRAIDGEQNP